MGVALLLAVTIYWLGLNVFLEFQKSAPGFPDLMTPWIYFGLYLVVAAVPGAALGAIVGIFFWAFVPASRSRLAGTKPPVISEY